MTDYNGSFDTSRLLVVAVVLGMLGLSYLDVERNHAHFDAQQFGIGIGAVLAGFAAALFGDAKRPDDKKPEPPK